METSELNLIRAIKVLGIDRARDIFAIASAWENDTGEFQPIAETASHKNMIALGKAVVSAMPKGKRGRAIDPNSKLQRVSKATLAYLHQHGTCSKRDLVQSVHEETGIDLVTCANYATQIKGIMRDCGTWSLPSDNDEQTND